jgi:hypothetical protein
MRPFRSERCMQTPGEMFFRLNQKKTASISCSFSFIGKLG